MGYLPQRCSACNLLEARADGVSLFLACLHCSGRGRAWRRNTIRLMTLSRSARVSTFLKPAWRCDRRTRSVGAAVESCRLQGASARQHHSVPDLQNEKSGCTACMDVCPVNAIEDRGKMLSRFSTVAVSAVCAPLLCPTEAIISPRLAPKTCMTISSLQLRATRPPTSPARAPLKRMPRENEVVVACVGDITAETWFSVLADYPNVSVYLPLGVCDKCRNTGGEDILARPLLPPRSGPARVWAWR